MRKNPGITFLHSVGYSPPVGATAFSCEQKSFSDKKGLKLQITETLFIVITKGLSGACVRVADRFLKGLLNSV